MKLNTLLAVFVVSLCGIATSSAATINFSTAYYAGIPAKFEDDNGIWWNTPLPWSLGKVNNAVDEFNQTTSVSFSIDSRFATYFSSGPTVSSLGYAQQISRHGVLISSEAGINYPTAAVSFSGLNTSLTYDLTFYASVGANGNSPQDRRMLIDILGETSIPQASLDIRSTATVPDEAAITIYGVQPDTDGRIAIAFSYPSALTTRGHINAISITSIPEPGSLAFLAVGAFAIVANRFWRKKQ